jgi:pilus assembly protein CpaF
MPVDDKTHPTLADSLRKLTGEPKKPEGTTIFRPHTVLIRERVTAVVEQLKRELDLSSLTTITEDTQAQVRARIRECVNEDDAPLTSAEKGILLQNVLDEIFGFGPLGPLLRDPSAGDIYVNSPREIYIERRGRLEKTDVCFDSEAHMMNIIERILLPLELAVNRDHPTVTAHLPNGSRASIAVPPVSIDGPVLTIRCFGTTIMSLRQLIDRGTISLPMGALLRSYILEKVNIVISGTPNSGRTTLLNAMSAYIDPGERIVTAEVANTLRLQHQHWVRLATRHPDEKGEGEIAIQKVLRQAFELGTDRLILGNAEGPELFDALRAGNLGVRGNIMKVLAASPPAVLRELELMLCLHTPGLSPEFAREIVTNGVQVIVHIEHMPDGVRRVTDIVEVHGLYRGKPRTTTMYKLKRKPGGDAEQPAWQHVAVSSKSHFVDDVEVPESSEQLDGRVLGH